ncbi:hypothetical protein JXA32_03845 [Candidatus Sumerlaeota bacterium]|nr:hypothetical protein [Candidatus Sumerlaeota bacterium]
MLSFCFHSLFREYGWRFFQCIAAPHPVRTAKALIDSSRSDCTKDGAIAMAPCDAREPILRGRRSIVGVGFCLKPINPPCLSGRANHECRYLEHLFHAEKTVVPACCESCAIRELGAQALQAGACFYIMTSAKDILFDVYRPALEEGRFTNGIFVLCRYSLKPFAAGLEASGMQGRLYPFESGDCADYSTWLLADRGIKNEQTRIDAQHRKRIRELLCGDSNTPNAIRKYEKYGNVYYPV